MMPDDHAAPPSPNRLSQWEEGAASHDLRSYGRRRGRKPSPRQAALLEQLLPGLALDISGPPPAPASRLFASTVDEVWLEIGFGGGEHLLWQARENPRVGLIGCEPFQDGVVKVLSAVEQERLGNIRLHAGDARPLLRWLSDSAITRAFILFPDPWPKTRHHKRRLLSATTVAALTRVVRPDGELRIATDVGDYARSILLAMREQPDFYWLADGSRDWRARTPDWPATRYEQKAFAAQRRCYYFRFRRS